MQSRARKWMRWGAGLGGALLVLLAVWQIWGANAGVGVVHLKPDGLPLTVWSPAGIDKGTRPVVLVGHGFAGSEVVMRGFSLTLAKAGYVVAAWDFDGHGSNARSWRADDLVQDAEQALAEVQRLGLADTSRVAILGHSMGSGVALTYGQIHPETSATIAISPVSRAVTPKLPHNLLLMAGSLEGSFVSSAQQRLAEAGGAGGDPAAGTGRQLVVIPGVEHVSILFAPPAHQTTRQWVDATFGPQPGAVMYRDHRILWYGLGVVGVLLLAAAISPVTAGLTVEKRRSRPAWRWFLALLVGAFGATLLLWLASMVGLNLSNFLGLLVGGYLMVWYGLAGLIGWLVVGTLPNGPSRWAILGGLLTFAALWLGVGLLGNFVWMPWLLIFRRLVIWPLGCILLFPWFLLAGEATGWTGFWGRAGWWLVQSVILVGGLSLALRLNTELGFIAIILPLFPIILGLHALGVAPQRGSWPYAISGALFTSWLLLAVFPLV
jgi:pimeloyl-ACP methyl ester carboxylesterase